MVLRYKKRKVRHSSAFLPLLVALLAFLLLVASLYLFPGFKAALGLKNLPTSFDEMRAEKVMGYKTVDIRKSLLAQARETEKLVISERAVTVDVEVGSMLWNIALFEKTKVIHATGLGVYGVDLTAWDDERVAVDHNVREVTLLLDSPRLLYVEMDYEKTTFEETKNALLAFGDIRLTQEQQAVVQRDIQKAMEEALAEEAFEEELWERLEEAAEKLFSPAIQALVPGYQLIILPA